MNARRIRWALAGAAIVQLAVIAVLVVPSGRPPVELPVTIGAGWRVGDRVTYEIISSHRHDDIGQYNPGEKLCWTESLELIERIPEGYVFSWTRGRAYLWPKKPMGAEFEEFEVIQKGTALEIVVDRDGRITDIRNFDDVIQMMNDTFEMLVRQRGDSEMMRAANKEMQAIAADRPAFVRHRTKRLAPVFADVGQTIRSGESMSASAKALNPIGMGRADVPVRQTIDIDLTDSDDGLLVVYLENVPTSDGHDQLLQQYTALAALASNYSDEETEELSRFVRLEPVGFRESIDCVYDPSIGWHQTIEYRQWFEISRTTRETTSEYRLISGP